VADNTCAVPNVQGVAVAQDQLDCQRLLGRLQVPILGVLAFCGDYTLTFTKLDIRGVHIHTPMLAAKEFSVPWRLALLVFGTSIRAKMEAARVLNNNAGSAFAVANDAKVEVTGGSVMTNNHAGVRWTRQSTCRLTGLPRALLIAEPAVDQRRLGNSACSPGTPRHAAYYSQAF
jgi:hypothetical protein